MAIWPQVCSRIVRCLMPATHIAVLSKLPQREKPTTTVIGRTVIGQILAAVLFDRPQDLGQELLGVGSWSLTFTIATT